ncbi:MAG: M60 family peptidase N-terminal accessory domain-containing protein, partial [Rikenellaceae bacterium]
MTRRFLYALLSLVLVVGCEFDNVDVEDSYIELGGETLGDVDLSPYWDWADAWPGAVGSTLERISDGEAVIEGGYEKFMYDYDGDVYALQSTGYYAAPTETIQVEVPVGTNTDNLYCQIGIGHALYEGQSRIRYDDVTLKTKLTVGTNRIMSYFGGHVYIYYNHDEGSIPAEDITLKFHNVIVSPDYVDGVTDERDWLATITPGTDDDGNEIEVLPYAEFRSETVIVTLETQYLQSESTQPGEHMAALNAYASAMLEYAGYMDTLSQQPVRLYMDIQLPDSSTSANFD